MKVEDLKGIFEKLSLNMNENKDYLIELDQAFGDGDLGISMSEGFIGVVEWQKEIDEKDFGKFLMQASRIYNEAAPSSLGTILSFFFMGMAKSTKGKEEVNEKEFGEALKAGYENIMAKAKSKLGEKTILDSLIPGVEAFIDAADNNDFSVASKKASEVAKEGAESTKDMVSVHGRAAYHGEKTLNHIDGGAYVGYLFMKGIADYFN